MKKTLIAASITLSTLTFGPLALAHEAGDWIVRGGVIHVEPDDESGKVEVTGLGKTGMEVSVDGDTQLGLNLAYMITDNWGVELLAATPFTHDVSLEKSELGLGDGALGEVSHLPPTLMAQYYFGNSSTQLRPYVGAGINYTVFFDESFKGSRKEQGFNSLDLDGSFGWSAQIGLDYMVDDNWLINGQVRYIDINTDANFKVGDAKSKVEIDIDPWVYMVGVGYKF
ncbi:OmpW family outer membrane protein [Echinimonas agarilytica]|uniref:Outer membrane beta-barrel protein n=1 Tax=Echinimonas agarilytica TaxID=1215918 RepID=A0AA41W6N3_9GAMM|nr:OmpW family outer membrane protein [Echinimonas agarilytica]MCM2679880.1 outer membrane beta-barrel protein [Echinimonas agarilytica]